MHTSASTVYPESTKSIASRFGWDWIRGMDDKSFLPDIAEALADQPAGVLEWLAEWETPFNRLGELIEACNDVIERRTAAATGDNGFDWALFEAKQEAYRALRG